MKDERDPSSATRGGEATEVAETAEPVAEDPGFEPLAELVRGFWAPRVLLTAGELDLFTVLGGQSLSAEELAGRLDGDLRGVEMLAQALTAMGLLHLEDGRYANTSLARRYLDAASPEPRTDYLRLGRMLWQRWSRLTEVVRVGSEAIGPEWSEADRRAFTLAMHQGKPHAGELLVSKLDLHGVRRIVDLGGGPGTFAEAFARALPDAQVILVDRTAAIEVAQERLPAELLEGRIVLVERDFIADGIPLAGDPPGPYDLALLSSVIHLFGPQENASLLGRVHECLEPGGQVVIRDFLLDESGTGPLGSALFAVNMLVNTEEGRVYRFEEVRSWLHEAGFGEVEQEPLEGAVALVRARRA